MPQTPHIEKHFTSGAVVRDVVIGMADGLTVPFALAAICEAMLQEGRLREAVSPCRRAAEKEPDSADRAMALGIALVRSGELAEAERWLGKATLLDPSLKHAYVELWNLYDRQGRLAEMTHTLDHYLQWNPQNIMFRVLKAAIEMESILGLLTSIPYP